MEGMWRKAKRAMGIGICAHLPAVAGDRDDRASERRASDAFSQDSAALAVAATHASAPNMPAWAESAGALLRRSMSGAKSSKGLLPGEERDSRCSRGRLGSPEPAAVAAGAGMAGRARGNPGPHRASLNTCEGMEDEVDSANDMVEQEESTGSSPGPSFSGRNTKRLRCSWPLCSTRAHKRPVRDKLQVSPSTQKSTVVAGSGFTQKKLPFSLTSQKNCLSTTDAMLQKKGLALRGIPNAMNQEVDQNSSHAELAAHKQKNQLGAALAGLEQGIPTNMNRKNLEVDQGELHKELVRIFAAHGHSSSIRAHDRFSKFVACLNAMVKMPDEYVMHRYFKELFDKEKTKLKEKLAALRSRVCLTPYVGHHDLLSTFLCLSVHYIDDEWEKQKKIIKFHTVDPSCSGEELSQSILYAINDWGLRDKVFSIILDDAFPDDSVTSDVKARLQKWNLRSTIMTMLI